MRKKVKKVTIQASEAEWTAMCFFAARGICSADKKQPSQPSPWQPMASEAMRLVERSAKRRVPVA